MLTGGEGRIQEGFRAWSGGAARELYILGAGRTVPVTRIVPEASRIPAEALSRIHVEGWSENTLENAFSAKSAVGEGKYSSVILVTSDYHIPRAYLAFRKVLPPEVSLSAIRVRPEGGPGASWRWARRHFLEGWKYLGVPDPPPVGVRRCVASEGGAPFVARRAMNLHGGALPHSPPLRRRPSPAAS